MHKNKSPTGAPLLLAAAVSLLVLTACGQRGELLGTFAPLPSPPTFGTPQRVAAIASLFVDEDPTFTGDLLDLFFMTNRDGNKDIWTSHRAAATDPWGSPTRVNELNSPSDDWSPSIAPDGLAIWFVTDRGSGHDQLWRSSRASRAAAWRAPQAVTEFAGGSRDGGPDIDDGEVTLYFSSDRASAGKFDIYLATRSAGNAPWGTPAPVAGINTADDDSDPFLAASGLALFLTRTTATTPGDIYWSARRSIDAPWSPPVPVATLNSTAYDSDASLSPDLRYIMFSSLRSGNVDIYEARAQP